MRINVLNYIASTDTLVLICDGHLITHVAGTRPEALSKTLHATAGMCDRDVCLAMLYAECSSFDQKDLVGMSVEYTDSSSALRFTGHNGGLISYTFDGQERHIHIDSLAVLHLKVTNGDDMTLNLENSLLALAYELHIRNGDAVSIIGLETRPTDLELGFGQCGNAWNQPNN